LKWTLEVGSSQQIVPQSEISTGEQVKQRCVGRIKLIAKTRQHHLSQLQEYKYNNVESRLLKEIRGGSFMRVRTSSNNYWT
jgi:hypothetical protein